MTHLQLDQMYSTLFDDEVLKNYEPFNYDVSKLKPTLEKKDVDVFMLEPSQGSIITNKKFSDIDLSIENNGFIIRSRISYVMAQRALNNYTVGCIILGTVINSLLFKAQEYKKDTLQSFKTVSFKNPINGRIFRELENETGYEIRLYITF
jgi:hypothetical protein